MVLYIDMLSCYLPVTWNGMTMKADTPDSSIVRPHVILLPVYRQLTKNMHKRAAGISMTFIIIEFM